MKSISLVDRALAFSAEHAVPVFPCRQDKSPLTRHGHKDASSDPAIIREMFADALQSSRDANRSITGVSVLSMLKRIATELVVSNGSMPISNSADANCANSSGGLHYFLGHIEGLPCSNNKIAKSMFEAMAVMSSSWIWL